MGYELEEHRERQRTMVPPMARHTDPEESHLHDRTLPKGERSLEILRRLRAHSPQTYVTLCDFGQHGGPAANRTLLTALERDGYVRKVGKIGNAAAFALTEKGARVAP